MSLHPPTSFCMSSTPCSHSYNITAVDQAGNVATSVVNYKVVYIFVFLSPQQLLANTSFYTPNVKSIPISFVLLGGSSIPVIHTHHTYFKDICGRNGT